MSQDLENFYRTVNFSRYHGHGHGHGQKKGFYESFYQRANHPTQPLAFWTRYTIFSAKNKPEESIGELWGVFFNGMTGEHVAIKKEWPLSHCTFDTTKFFVKVGEAILQEGSLKGELSADKKRLGWNLTFETKEKPSPFMPLHFYERRFPVAKSAIGFPMARYNGTFIVNGREIPIRDWVGSQNHNWGYKHTDQYALGQVAGFDNSADSFFEIATARMKIGCFKFPALTPAVLRHRGREHTFYNLWQALKSRGSYRYFVWDFHVENKDLEIDGTIAAPKNAFVAFVYYNPPGDIKNCLNTKIASCHLRLRYKNLIHDLKNEELIAQHRSLFEILTGDFNGHGVSIVGADLEKDVCCECPPQDDLRK